MKDVLKSLYSQAVIHTVNMCGKAHADGPRDFQEVVNEKFAELIVNDVLNIVAISGEHCICSTLFRKISEHFGIEE